MKIFMFDECRSELSLDDFSNDYRNSENDPLFHEKDFQNPFPKIEQTKCNFNIDTGQFNGDDCAKPEYFIQQVEKNLKFMDLEDPKLDSIDCMKQNPADEFTKDRIFHEDESEDNISNKFPSTNLPKKTKVIIKDETKSQEQKRSYDHLKGKRRQRRFQDKLNIKAGGYWTKNLLQFGKNIHLDFILEFMGEIFISQYSQILKPITEKGGMAMDDYQTLYNMPELEQCWQVFFEKNILYRELMLSKVTKESRPNFVIHLPVFEEAFRKKQFIRVSRIIDDENSL